MPLTIYFLRHGQTHGSKENKFCGSGLDIDLTPEGEEMARQFAAFYSSKPWTAVYCSPMRRALATAKPLCEKLGIEPKRFEGLKEIAYGKWEGLTVEDAKRDFHDSYIRWSVDPAWNGADGGESAVDVERRAMPAVDEIAKQYTDGNVLVVSHKATIRIILCSLLGIDLGRFRQRLECPVASVSVVEFRAQGPMLLSLADRTHMTAELRNLAGT
ncbi:MAG: histidine phosphatase family protein [Bdellovibrionota bacterium]